MCVRIYACERKKRRDTEQIHKHNYVGCLTENVPYQSYKQNLDPNRQDISNVFFISWIVLLFALRVCVHVAKIVYAWAKMLKKNHTFAVLEKTEVKLRGLFKDWLYSGFCYFVRTFTRLACLFTNGKPTRIKTSKLALCCVELCKDPWVAVFSCCRYVPWIH